MLINMVGNEIKGQALPTLAEIEAAAEIVYRAMPPTSQYRWPLLERRLGREVWVKHENHTPVGSFKVRGGLVHLDAIAKGGNRPAGVIAATRGNHGQSIAFSAARHGVRCTIVVPHGNSKAKNAAMIALGARLIEEGDDFQASLEYAMDLAKMEDLQFVPTFHLDLVRGVATYALEFFRGVSTLDAVYVPIGLGSGICGMLAARDALELSTEVVGVAAEGAPAIANSLRSGRIVEAPAKTIADGIAVRRPNDDAFAILAQRKQRVVVVSDDGIAAAVRALFDDTHNAAEGAGGAALAAAAADAAERGYERIGVVLSGGNINSEDFAKLLRADVN